MQKISSLTSKVLNSFHTTVIFFASHENLYRVCWLTLCFRNSFVTCSLNQSVSNLFRSNCCLKRSKVSQIVYKLYGIVQSEVKQVGNYRVTTTVIRRNKTLPTCAGIRPFLSGLYYHQGKIFEFFQLSKQLSGDFTYEMSYWEVMS